MFLRPADFILPHVYHLITHAARSAKRRQDCRSHRGYQLQNPLHRFLLRHSFLKFNV